MSSEKKLITNEMILYECARARAYMFRVCESLAKNISEGPSAILQIIFFYVENM